MDAQVMRITASTRCRLRRVSATKTSTITSSTTARLPHQPWRRSQPPRFVRQQRSAHDGCRQPNGKNEWMNEWMNETFLFPRDKNWLLLHASVKEDNGKTETKRWAVRSPWRQSGWSPVGSPVDICIWYLSMWLITADSSAILVHFNEMK